MERKERRARFLFSSVSRSSSLSWFSNSLVCYVVFLGSLGCFQGTCSVFEPVTLVLFAYRLMHKPDKAVTTTQNKLEQLKSIYVISGPKLIASSFLKIAQGTKDLGLTVIPGWPCERQ